MVSVLPATVAKSWLIFCLTALFCQGMVQATNKAAGIAQYEIVQMAMMQGIANSEMITVNAEIRQIAAMMLRVVLF